MPPNIQNISPSYVIRVLIPEQYGTYILRHATLNDELISLIQIRDQPNTHRYVVLSVRVDETIYKNYIQHYRLSLTEQNNQENVMQLLETYNEHQKNVKNGKFTPLTLELIAPPENLNWYLDPKYFQDINFGRDQNGGKNNQGISEATWQSPRQNSVKVFIKRFHKDHWYFKHELSLLKQFCFFSIITLYGQYSDNHFSYLVFADGGKSLESHCPLKFRSKMRFIANVGFQVAYGMMYLEQKNIVHRDLTAGNVLLDSYGFIRIADFGHAIKKEEGTNSLERSLTNTGEKRFQFRFLSPECLPDLKRRITSNTPTTQTPVDVYASFTSKSDVWSFGILLIQLMIEDPTKPYPHISDINEIPRYVKEKGNIHPQPSNCHIDMYLVLKQCWAYEAKNRISFTDIREKMLKLTKIFNNQVHCPVNHATGQNV